MFRTLRLRFIAIASLAILIVLFSIVGILNSARHFQTVAGINKMLHLISDNDGTLPSASEATRALGDKVSVDSLFQYRYFSAILDDNGNIISLNSSNISDLTNQQVKRDLTQINQSDKTTGFFRYHHHTYAYLVTPTQNKSRVVVVLDSTNQFNDDKKLLYLSLWLSGIDRKSVV